MLRQVLGRVLGWAALALMTCLAPAVAQAGVDIRVDLSTQRMQVRTADGQTHDWAISSGRQGYRTIRGSFRPTRLEKKWYSRKYGGNMPNAIFFHGGFAIHGTGEIARLGRPASHGCVRLHPANAARLFALVQKHGKAATRIAIHGVAPDTGTQFAKARPAQQKVAAGRDGARKLAAKPRKPVDWATARGRILERDALFETSPALGFRPVAPSQGGWRLR